MNIDCIRASEKAGVWVVWSRAVYGVWDIILGLFTDKDNDDANAGQISLALRY